MKTNAALRSALSVLVFSLIKGTGYAQSPDAFDPNPDRDVSSVLLLPDGKVLVGGNFRTLAGTNRRGIGRLNADGSLDSTFTPSLDTFTPSLEASSFACEPDGNLLVSGYGLPPVGYAFYSITARLNTEGKPLGVASVFSSGVIWLRQDGRILAAGDFTDWPSSTFASTRLVRLNADLTLDRSFNPNPNSGEFNYLANVSAVAEQPDQKILVGGHFHVLAGQSLTNFGRLLPDGTLDADFKAPSIGGIETLALQPDGKILVGGSLNVPWAQGLQGLARLNPDGTLDSGFNPNIAGFVTAIALQANGQLLAGGWFGAADGQSFTSLARVNSDGTLDSTFDPHIQASSDMHTVVLQPDGKILLAGAFGGFGSTRRYNLARLINTTPATQDLSLKGPTLTWLRGGSSPEVLRTSFDSSSDGGASWNHLGEGVRIPGGWEWRPAAALQHSLVRARGFTADSFVETIIGPPVVLESPQSRTNLALTSAKFNVYGGGTDIGCQWLKNGASLADGGNVSGALTSCLTIKNVLGADAGTYSVLITNSLGSVTSAVATLTVIDPVIQVQPLSVTRFTGQSASFTVAPVGTPPFNYQWRKEGLPIPGATTSSLTLSNVLNSDAAAYDLIVMNGWGSASSQPALLTINQVVLDSFSPSLFRNEWPSAVLAIQPDGRILVAGSFYETNLVRLNTDGSVDGSFRSAAFATSWHGLLTLATQPDGKVLAGGEFTSVAGQSRTNLARLNPDGTLDPTFTCNLVSSYFYGAFVSALLVQPDGKILVGGKFEAAGNTNFVRINPDGSLDSTFNSGRYPSVVPRWGASYQDFNPVHTIAVDPDGRILVGGWISYGIAVQDFSFLTRLKPNGEPDTNFNSAVGLNLQFQQPGHLNALLVQPDGKILVAGGFVWLAGDFRTNIARLNPDGTLDPGFDPGADNLVTSLALQADGKLLVAGWFRSIGGQPRSGLARLNPDGTVDPAFDPGTDTGYTGLALQADGNILVTGNFHTLAGQSRTNFGRLDNLGQATQQLSYDGSAITWNRGGTSPQLRAATFEYSSDGSRWNPLGSAVPTTNAWQLREVSLPHSSIIRGRGYINGGGDDSCSWLVESVSSPVLAITDFKLLSAGLVQFTVLGPAKRNAIILTSSDLKTWSPLATNQLTDGYCSFEEFQSSSQSRRFYGVRQLPGDE